jgi:hypothetical protein
MANLVNIPDLGKAPESWQQLLLSFNRLDVPYPYPSNPPTTLQTYLQLKEPFWYENQSITASITPSGGTLASRDGRSSISIPAQAVSDSVTLEYRPQPWLSDDTGSMKTVNTRFYLEALDSAGNPKTGFSFAAPITVTLSYTDDDVVGLGEDQILLYYWDTTSSVWKDASQTCSSPSKYIRDLVHNTLTVSVCHLTEFALVGPPMVRIYLPLTVRSK